eukprot:CFRG5954T1
MMAHGAEQDDFTIDVGDDIFTPDAELDFQDFSELPTNGTTTAYKPPSSSYSQDPPVFTGILASPAVVAGGNDYSFESTESTIPSSASRANDLMGHSIWTLAYYSKYFDVDVATVSSRILLSVNPTKKDFLNTTAGNPDLYGPFWVTTTLIVCMAITGNLATVLSPHEEKGYKYEYDFTKLTFAASLMYGYITIFPLLIWAFVNFYVKQSCVLLELVCLFGYSVFMFIPVSILCVLPIETMRWLAVVLGFGTSSAVLLGNLYPMIHSLHQKTAYIVLGVTAAAQALLAIIFKLYFFEYSS